MKTIIRWFDRGHAMTRRDDSTDRWASQPFAGLHLACAAVFRVGFSTHALWVAIASYLLRTFECVFHHGSASFDKVVLACHADDALRLIEPSGAERDVLGTLAYRDNVAVPHSDESAMPCNRRAWSSWNVTADHRDSTAVLPCHLLDEPPAAATRRPAVPRLAESVHAAPQRLGRAPLPHPVFTTASGAPPQPEPAKGPTGKRMQPDCEAIPRARELATPPGPGCARSTVATASTTAALTGAGDST